MITEEIIGAIEEAMYWRDAGPVNRAHVACAYHLLLLCLWLESKQGYEYEADATRVMAFCALREANRDVVSLILGIAWNGREQ